ncbi:MAG: hypothetical protein Q8P46_15890, partial [Hyphomicrobiales bacterium]|nr:hypothetical protein [Hyphomicrobiales bacterium]
MGLKFPFRHSGVYKFLKFIHDRRKQSVIEPYGVLFNEVRHAVCASVWICSAFRAAPSFHVGSPPNGVAGEPWPAGP